MEPTQSGPGRADPSPTAALWIEISVPASAVYLQALRSVVGSAGHLLGFSYAGIESLALAVDEAASLLLDTAPDKLLLTLKATDDGALEMRLVSSVAMDDWPPDDLTTDTRWQIVDALTDRPVAVAGAGILLSSRP